MKTKTVLAQKLKSAKALHTVIPPLLQNSLIKKVTQLFWAEFPWKATADKRGLCKSNHWIF